MVSFSRSHLHLEFKCGRGLILVTNLTSGLSAANRITLNLCFLLAEISIIIAKNTNTTTYNLNYE